MHAAGLGFAWAFWRRQRVFLVPALGYLGALVVLVNMLPTGTIDAHIVGQLALPLICVFPWLIGVFCYGDQADILLRESGYPRRAFTLPLRTTALVGWPMALGTTAIAAYWLVFSGLVFRSAGVPVPVVWPALFAAGLLAMTQALIWLPFPLTALRIFVVIPVLSALIAAAVLGGSYELSPMVLTTASAGLLPIAYAIAVFGVARARRGDIPVRSWPLLERSASGTGDDCPPFGSPTAALAWLEWRSNLFLLPRFALLVLLPLLLVVFFLSKLGATPLLGLATYPLFMGLTAGGSLGNCHSWKRNEPAIPVFLAACPVTSGTLLGIKFRSALFTTLLTWGLIVVALAVLLPFSSAGPVLLDRVGQLMESQGTLRGTVWLLLVAVGLPAFTWKVTVDQFWFGLTGRQWVILLASIAVPTVLTGLGVGAAWGDSHAGFRDAMIAAVPWLGWTALTLKLALGGLVGWDLLRRGLIAPRTAVWFAAGWLIVAAALVALALWLIPPAIDSPLLIGIGAVVLGLPLVRLGLAPLALEWNRHR